MIWERYEELMPGSPCDLVLAEPVSVHAVPHGLRVDAGKLR